MPTLHAAHAAIRRALLCCACLLALLTLTPHPAAAAPPTATIAATTAATVATAAQAVVAAARALIGSPYAYIGDDPSTGFSCIGFVHYLYAQVGVAVPYDLNAAFGAGPRVAADGLQPGDLVFFGGTVWSGLSHVAVYAGADEIIGADTYATGVELTRLSDPYWTAHYVGATRPLDALAPQPAPSPQPTPSPPPTPAPTPPASPGPLVYTGETLAGRTAAVVYTGPGYSYPALDRLLPRVIVRVVRRQGTWTNVVYQGPGSDDYGWVDRAYVQACAPLKTATPGHSHKSKVTRRQRTAVVMASLLFVRQGPARDRPVLARLHRGQRVALLTTRGAWAQVHLAGVTGWAFGRWLA